MWSCLALVVCSLLVPSLPHSAAAGERSTRHLLYSVKSGEGFNLRRDVHMRAATLVRILQEKTGRGYEWVLVLPPWPRLYHWKSSGQVPYQPWAKYFDLPSLNRFVPSIEFDVYLQLNGHLIDEVMVLQHFKGEFTVEDFGKIEEQPCTEEQYSYKRTSDERWEGRVFGERGIAIRTHHCFSAMGEVSLIFPHLQRMNGNSILVENFEILLHDRFGDSNYWGSRYSMVYAAALRQAGNRFTSETLGYQVAEGATGRDSASNGGGHYISAHLRRQDYLYAHKDAVPSLEGAASQLNTLKTELGLEAVFLASDASLEDKKALQRMVKGLVWYTPTDDELSNYGDGGVAIIDQWVAAHARHFVGTAHSTFSFRIREDRQFLRFSKESTYNDVCGPSDNEHDPHSCKQPTYWKWDEGPPPEPLYPSRPPTPAGSSPDREEL